MPYITTTIVYTYLVCIQWINGAWLHCIKFLSNILPHFLFNAVLHNRHYTYIHTPSLLPCCYVCVWKLKVKENYFPSVLFHYDKISLLFCLILINMYQTQLFDMYRFILFTFTNKSNNFSMCKHNNILHGNHDGENADYEKWYKNGRSNGATSTTLKCWLKISVKRNFHCWIVSWLFKEAYVYKVFW